MMSDDATGWARGLDELGQRLAPCFSRVEPRRRVLAYLKGLLAPIARKNGWRLAEAAGDATPDGVQDFLARARWEADGVRAYVVEHRSDPQAVLMLDETGFVKKGTHSVGVQRQHSGTAGRIENCQIGVFLGYASPKGHALIDRGLYLPESWTKDRARGAAAGVPEGVAFATKPKLGRRMLARALAAGVPCAWVVGDSVYGADYALRRFVQAHGRGSVLAVTGAQRLGFKPVEDWLEDVPALSRVRLSAGAKGPRLGLSAVSLRYGSRLAQGPADPPQDRQARSAHLLSHARADPARRSGAGGWHALDHRGVLRGGQRRGRAGRVRGALLDRLAPPYHARDAGACLSDRRATSRGRGKNRASICGWSCCPIRCPKCAGCSGS